MSTNSRRYRSASRRACASSARRSSAPSSVVATCRSASAIKNGASILKADLKVRTTNETTPLSSAGLQACVPADLKVRTTNEALLRTSQDGAQLEQRHIQREQQS